MEEVVSSIMEQVASWSSLAVAAAIGIIVCWVLYGRSEWQKSQRIRRKLRMQGIGGPPPSSFLHGNLPDIQRIKAQAAAAATATNNTIESDFTTSLFPYFENWRKQYGLVYTYSTGLKQHLYVNEPELVREMNRLMTLDLGKPSHITKNLAPLLGNGVIRSNGLTWAHQRKLVAAEFFMDKVKGMVGLMIESTQPLLTKWESLIEEGNGSAEVKIDEDVRSLSADVISRVCFGHSYSKGKEVFAKIRTMQKIVSKNTAFLYGVTSFRDKLKFWKKKENEITIMEKEVESLIWSLVEERKRECLETSSSEKDLMQLLLEAATSDESSGKDFPKRFVVDNCKNIYFAGHETIALTASWCLMLLAVYPEWQDRVRSELAQLFPNGIFDADSVPLLKTLTMVIQEALRLYPPAPFVSREAYKDIQIGTLHVPKGVCLWTLVPTMHRDPAIWGSDANEFKPERFSEGLSNACKYPQSYAPFGLGTRLCLGKNFAMVQLNVILALIISRFSFTLSPSYKHSPAYNMLVEPGHGVYIIIQKV